MCSDTHPSTGDHPDRAWSDGCIAVGCRSGCEVRATRPCACPLSCALTTDHHSEACAALRDMAAAGCGLRIVSIHWGHEFEGTSSTAWTLHADESSHPSQLTHFAPGYPTVCQMRVARILVAAGADIVLGAHSHTQQPAEVLLVNGFAGDTGDEQAALAHVPECCRLFGVEGPPRKALVLYGMGAHCVIATHMSPLSPPDTTAMRPACLQATSAAPCSTRSAASACS